ncbi:hypothetical protein PoB_006601200 [Plakobranchus ocellatus]|uniref:Uncharacterized protein n=1 Tax=Plakobranchus ocellatus TaxID=259542 RepID=A0AAV4D5U6_9GAST|nr:hypothetical protein PoB_006601200 [Plakobranchus ocellatus]
MSNHTEEAQHNGSNGWQGEETVAQKQARTETKIRGMSEKKQEKGHNSKSFHQINLKLTQIEVHSFTTSQRKPRGDRCIFASATAAN